MRVMVNVGDTIARDQPVLELETDKATIEVPSNVAGTVKEVRVKKGDKIKVGAVVFTVDEAAGNGAGASPAAAAAEQPAPTVDAKPAEQAAPPAADEKTDAKPAAEHKVLPMPQRNAEPARNPEPVRSPE